MQKFWLLVAAGLLSLPLAAQDKVDVFGGYQYLHIGDNSSVGITSQGFNGWNAAAAFNFNKHLGVEGDFGGAYAKIGGASWHIYTYTGGPVIFTNIDRLKPFAHALFGGTQLTGSESGVSVSWNGFATMVGGGVDATVNRALAIRLVQFDWLYYHFGSKAIGGTQIPSFSGSNNVRISTGVVVRF